MKKFLTPMFIALMGISSVACSYGSAATHSNGKLYLARNDNFLFGALRKMYECTPDGAGNMTCVQVKGAP